MNTTTTERITAALLDSRATVSPALVAAIAVSASVEEIAAAFRMYAAARIATAMRKRELEEALHADGWSRRAAKAEASHRVANQSPKGDTYMNTTSTTAAERIATLLHMSRTASWTSDQTLELSAAMKGQPPEVLAMALLQFSQGLLHASRQVVELQIDCANGQAARDEGRLQ